MVRKTRLSIILSCVTGIGLACFGSAHGASGALDCGTNCLTVSQVIEGQIQSTIVMDCRQDFCTGVGTFLILGVNTPVWIQVANLAGALVFQIRGPSEKYGSRGNDYYRIPMSFEKRMIRELGISRLPDRDIISTDGQKLRQNPVERSGEPIPGKIRIVFSPTSRQ